MKWWLEINAKNIGELYVLAQKKESHRRPKKKEEDPNLGLVVP